MLKHSAIYMQKGMLIHTSHNITSNWKWITNLNVKFATTKLLEENIAMNFCDFGLDKIFSDTTAKAWFLKEKIDDLGTNIIKNLLFDVLQQN